MTTPSGNRRKRSGLPSNGSAGTSPELGDEVKVLQTILKQDGFAVDVDGVFGPETESAVHTIPASAITKNMPVVPETPKRSSTMEEMMMVSMVIPDTGLRAVVAMALAATEVKKKENNSARATPVIMS